MFVMELERDLAVFHPRRYRFDSLVLSCAIASQLLISFTMSYPYL